MSEAAETQGNTQSEAPAAQKGLTLEDVLVAQERANERLISALNKPAAVAPLPPPPDPFAGVDPSTLEGEKLANYIKHRSRREAQEIAAEATTVLKSELDTLKQQAAATANHIAVQQVHAFAAKTPDFEAHVPAMTQLRQQYPNAPIEDLYAIAKARAPKGKTEATATTTKPAINAASERPSTSSARPPLTATRETPLPPGRRGFRMLAREGVSALGKSRV